jgi:predicted dehydrogenase
VVTPLRIGLAGYGFGGRYFHAPFLASAAECEFLGVITTSPQRRNEFAEQFPGRATFDSLEHLAAAGAEAVTISTPASTHVELTQRALRLGLAVVCDKPFALDASSARQTVLLSEQVQRPLTVYQNRRWDSDFRTVRKALADHLLGDPVRFESRFERFAPDPGPSASGGGTLLDFGSHLVDQALVLFGPASSVYAEMHTRDGSDTRQRGAFAPVGQVAPERAGSALPCDRDGRKLHRRSRHGRPGRAARNGALTGDARGLGNRARAPVGTGISRRAGRTAGLRARSVGPVLPGLR